MNTIIQKFKNYKEIYNNNREFLKLCKTGKASDIENFLRTTPTNLININTCDRDNNNGYLLACVSNKPEVLSLLDSYDINIQHVNYSSQNAFLMAVWHGNKEVLDYLKDKVNISKLDKNGNNAYIYASLKGNTKIMYYLENALKINIHHNNFNGDNAFTIHKNLCTSSASPQILQNMKKSVIYLAKRGYNIKYVKNTNTIPDVLYQLYYKYDPKYYLMTEDKVIKCVCCNEIIKENQNILMCKHNHLYHVYCFIMKACETNRSKYRGYFHIDRANLLESCSICNEPFILKQSNLRTVKNVEELK